MPNNARAGKALGARACAGGYSGTSLIRQRTPLGPYRRPTPRVLGESYVGERFLMGEVAL